MSIRQYAGAVMDYFHSGTGSKIEMGAEGAAIFVMGALVAPTWNTPVGSGALSQYMMMVAKTGAGKERYTYKGIMKFLNKICPELLADKFPASQVAFFRQLTEMPGLVLCMDELGSMLKASLSNNAASSSRQIAQAYLTAYSGQEKLQGTANKKVEDSTPAVSWAIPSIIGGLTLDSWNSMAKLEAFREDGLTRRFEILVVNDIVVPDYLEKLNTAPPSNEILEIFARAGADTIRACQRKGEVTQAVTFPMRKFLSIEDSAMRHWNEVSQRLSVDGQSEGGLFGGYKTGTGQRIMRTASVLCFYRDSREISLGDVEVAIDWHLRNLAQCERLIVSSSFDNTTSKLCDAIMRQVEVKRMMNKTELRRSEYVLKTATKRELDEALSILEEMGSIGIVKDKTAGPPRVTISFKQQFTWSER
jgi:hypothetical protein